MYWKCKCKVPGNAMYFDATYVTQVQDFEIMGALIIPLLVPIERPIFDIKAASLPQHISPHNTFPLTHQAAPAARAPLKLTTRPPPPPPPNPPPCACFLHPGTSTSPFTFC